MNLCYLGNAVVLLVELFHYKTVYLVNLDISPDPSNVLDPVYLNY